MYLIDRFSQLLRCEVVLHLINTYIYQVFTTGSNFNYLAVFSWSVFLCFPLFSLVFLFFPLFSYVFPFSLFSYVFPCFFAYFFMFSPVFLCFLLSSNISPCFSNSSSVFLCCFLCPYDSPCFLLFLLILIPMFSSVIPCFPMFPTVFICFPMFSKVLYGEPSFIYHFLQKMYPVWKAYHISMRFSLHLF